jgi:hypothetical protein
MPKAFRLSRRIVVATTILGRNLAQLGQRMAGELLDSVHVKCISEGRLHRVFHLYRWTEGRYLHVLGQIVNIVRPYSNFCE